MYDQILVPLDGSGTAEAVLAFVELIPSRRVRLLMVEPDARGPILAGVEELAAWRAEREALGLAYLERVGEPLRRQGRDVETVVAFGDPAAQIAAATDVGLVAMATQGRGAGGRALFGSVADRVARHAPVATLLVRGGENPAAPPPLTRLVVPLDGSAAAEAALAAAARLGGELGVPLHLVRVVEHDALRATVRAGAAAATAASRAAAAATRDAKAYVDDQVRALRNRDLAAGGQVLIGVPAPALLDAVRPGDLVVMATRGRGGVRRWLLGSVAEKLVRAASAPVLLVRADGSDRTKGAAQTVPERG